MKTKKSFVRNIISIHILLFYSPILSVCLFFLFVNYFDPMDSLCLLFLEILSLPSDIWLILRCSRSFYPGRPEMNYINRQVLDVSAAFLVYANYASKEPIPLCDIHLDNKKILRRKMNKGIILI